MTYDPFFRTDIFQNKPWYGELRIFLAIGVCEVPDKYVGEIRSALRKLGHETRITAAKYVGRQMVIGNGLTKAAVSDYVMSTYTKG